jgi:hypothetical protein
VWEPWWYAYKYLGFLQQNKIQGIGHISHVTEAKKLGLSKELGGMWGG